MDDGRWPENRGWRMEDGGWMLGWMVGCYARTLKRGM